jgi:hypothetical protein
MDPGRRFSTSWLRGWEARFGLRIIVTFADLFREAEHDSCGGIRPQMVEVLVESQSWFYESWFSVL